MRNLLSGKYPAIFFDAYGILKTAVKLLLKKGSVRSYGQFGEDAFICALFRNKKHGYYVDVGAYHPHLYSNTYALYRKGWRGIVIEPNKRMHTLFRLFRHRDIFVSAGIGFGEKAYIQNEDGAYNSFTEGSGIKLRKLSEILAAYDVRNIDFLNIDTEGMDLEVLETHDWTIKPTVIAVESSVGGKVQGFLEAKNYELKGMLGLTLIFKLR